MKRDRKVLYDNLILSLRNNTWLPYLNLCRKKLLPSLQLIMYRSSLKGKFLIHKSKLVNYEKHVDDVKLLIFSLYVHIPYHRCKFFGSKPLCSTHTRVRTHTLNLRVPFLETQSLLLTVTTINSRPLLVPSLSHDSRLSHLVQTFSTQDFIRRYLPVKFIEKTQE